MNEVYLKIYVENGDTIVFEGQGREDKPGYYPSRWDNTTKRVGTLVVGKNHISITDEARTAFRKIIREAHYIDVDLSFLDIFLSCESKKDGTPSDECHEVAISYIGDVIEKWDIEKVIHDKGFFIGTGKGFPQINLLDELPEWDDQKS